MHLLLTSTAAASMTHVSCLTLLHTLHLSTQVAYAQVRALCLFVLPSITLSSAAAASVTSIDMSHNCLTPSVAAELQQHLPRFPALQRVNVSINPFLGRAGVALIASSLAGV